MEYFEYKLEMQMDFTHPYMTINQMKKMITQNYSNPRDFVLYGYSTEEMIQNLNNQVYEAFPSGPELLDLRMPILVFPIPTGEMWDPVKYGFIVKYDSNGETVIYSPIKIPSLEKDNSPFSDDEIKKYSKILDLFDSKKED